MNEDLRGHFCGQTQPHHPHNWQTPPIYGSTTPTSYYQCAGYALARDEEADA